MKGKLLLLKSSADRNSSSHIVLHIKFILVNVFIISGLNQHSDVSKLLRQEKKTIHLQACEICIQFLYSKARYLTLNIFGYFMHITNTFHFEKHDFCFVLLACLFLHQVTLPHMLVSLGFLFNKEQDSQLPLFQSQNMSSWFYGRKYLLQLLKQTTITVIAHHPIKLNVTPHKTEHILETDIVTRLL